MWLGGELYIVATDLGSDTSDYTDWSLNNPFDWLGTGGSAKPPGWTQCVAQYAFYRPIGSETSVKIWQVQGPTASVDHFAGFESVLVPMDAASTPFTTGAAYVNGVIDTGNAQFWRNTWPHTTGRVLNGSDFNSVGGHANLKGKFTTWSAITGQFSNAERYDPVFLTAKASALSTGKISSWNLVVSAINPTALEEFSYQAVVHVRYKIEFSVKDVASYTFDQAKCDYYRALKQSEAYRVIRHINGKVPRGQLGRVLDKPIYIGISDTPGPPGESKGDSKGYETDLDSDMELLDLKTPVKKPTPTLPGVGPGSQALAAAVKKPLAVAVKK